MACSSPGKNRSDNNQAGDYDVPKIEDSKMVDETYEVFRLIDDEPQRA
jgi:hypothetical protein